MIQSEVVVSNCTAGSISNHGSESNESKCGGKLVLQNHRWAVPVIYNSLCTEWRYCKSLHTILYNGLLECVRKNYFGIIFERNLNCFFDKKL